MAKRVAACEEACGKRLKGDQQQQAQQQQRQPERESSCCSTSCNSGIGSCTLQDGGGACAPALHASSRPVFLQADEAEYQCSICSSLLVDPVVGLCGHDYCRGCLEQRVESCCVGQAALCPSCGHSLVAPGLSTLGVCLRLQRLIERLFPVRLAERRLEVDAQLATRAALRSMAMQRQLDTVMHILQLRVQRQAAQAETTHAPRPSEQPEGEPEASSSLTAVAPRTPSHPTLSPTLSPATLHTWHRPLADLPRRRATAAALLHIFYSRRPGMVRSFRERLPSLVCKLEDALYRAAPSLERYADTATLEPRVQQLVQRLTQQRTSTLTPIPGPGPSSPGAPAQAGPGGQGYTYPQTWQLHMPHMPQPGWAPFGAAGDGAAAAPAAFAMERGDAHVEGGASLGLVVGLPVQHLQALMCSHLLPHA